MYLLFSHSRDWGNYESEASLGCTARPCHRPNITKDWDRTPERSRDSTIKIKAKLIKTGYKTRKGITGVSSRGLGRVGE